jgi:hypothetical protein
VEDRVSGLEDKINIKEKTEEYIEKDWRVVKGMCKNSVTPSKDQTYESWASKKEKRCMPKV